MTRRVLASVLAPALIAVLWGCGAAATPIPSVGAPSAAASAPGSSAAAPSSEASAAQPSAEASAGSGASGAIPSFNLPSEAKDLEALLPGTLCGETAIKVSLSGATFAAQADEEFKSTLAALGKSPSDVSFAVAGSQSGCTAGIFRVAGIDTTQLQTTFLAEEQKSGTTYTQQSVSGKTVFQTDVSGNVQYVYFKGDAAIFAQGKDAATAAQILTQLP